MGRKAMVRGVGALVAALALVVLLAGPVYAQADEVIEEPGVLITGVLADSPAAVAGLKRGDIILAADGQSVNSGQELADVVRAAEPGETLELTVLHGDEESSVSVALAERDGQAFLGVRPYNEDVLMPAMPMRITPLEPISGTEPVTLTLDEREGTLPGGAVVMEVVEGSPAEAAGIQPGDVIVAVDGVQLADAAELVERVAGYAPETQVVLDVLSLGELVAHPVTVILGARPDDESQAYLGVSVAPAPFEVKKWGESDEWKGPEERAEPDEDWECPMIPEGYGYPHHGHMGRLGPMMPYGGRLHGPMGWGGAMRILPYGGQRYGWRR